MTRREYSDETRAAVMAALLAGQSVSSVAKEYDIPKGTVSGWKDRVGGVAKEATQKKEEISELLVELVISEIKNLLAISAATRDQAWIKKQNASDLAVYSGVKQDKLFRMLEAFGRSENDSD